MEAVLRYSLAYNKLEHNLLCSHTNILTFNKTILTKLFLKSISSHIFDASSQTEDGYIFL